MYIYSFLGGKVVDSVEEATIVVANKISMSASFLSAVGSGKLIVGDDWIIKSYRQESFQSNRPILYH